METTGVTIPGSASALSVKDWYALPNLPMKAANALPNAPGCATSGDTVANDSVMLYLRLRAPTNAQAFSFNSYFFSAEYPEYVCTTYNDQYVALVDTPTGTPSPIPNPVDKDLAVYWDGTYQWPVGVNIAAGTELFSVCGGTCGDADVDPESCSLGASQLEGTGFQIYGSSTCAIGGGTFWLTTSGNAIPGEILELRIAIWDVGDHAFDSAVLIDGFQWLANPSLPGTH